MEMSHIYDEDLMENLFFQQLCEACSSLYRSAVENGWLICVPKVGTFESHKLTELDFMSHVLIEVEPSLYKTASDMHVQIKDKVIILGEGFEKPLKIEVLFNETFYTDKQTRYQVWCVDKPLSFESTTPVASAQAHTAEFRIQNVDDSAQLLFSGRDCSLKKTIDKFITNHKVALLGLSDRGTHSIRDLIDTMHSLFTQSIQACSKDNMLKKRVNLNKHVADNLRISVETYITHNLYNDLFKYICTAVAADDAKLNKINRNLSQIQLKDLGFVSDFSANLPRARRELLSFDSFSTPLAKMACVKRTILALMQSPRNAQGLVKKKPTKAEEISHSIKSIALDLQDFVDDFRKVITNPKHMMANFEYMTQFHFSKSSTDDYSFYMSTLEAALFFVKSGELTKMLADDQDKVDLARHRNGSPSRRKISLVDTLFENVKLGDLDIVRSLLEDSNDSQSINSSVGYKSCHPLCSCDNCERTTHEEEQDPTTKVTVFSRDDRGYTAMHQAAMYNKPEIVEYLKRYGGLVNATDYHGSTPLHVACQKGHQSATMMVIDCGGDVNAGDNDGNRPLHLAALNGHEECINALIYQTSLHLPLDVNAANENGDTALHLSAKWSYESITELLVKHDAYPEARNRRNASPLMLVSDGKIAKILTAAIERAQEKANDGFVELIPPITPPARPVFLASDISSQNKSAAISINQPSVTVRKKVKKFLRAVSDCDINMMKHLMGWTETQHDSSSDSDSDLGDDSLCHPLCQCRKCAPAQRVHASLVDVNAGDEQGRTALHIAAEKSNLEIATLLVQKHADVNCKTNLVQFTPLHLACQQLDPNKKLVELLIKYGGKVNCKDCNGRTPLHFSSQTGSVVITQLLLENGANVHATNIRGNTPLHEAAKVNNTEIVRELDQHHSNPLLTNKNGLTALQLTSESRIRWILTQAVEKHRYPSPVLDSKIDDDNVSQVQGKAQGSVSLGQAPSMKNELFAALEADDTPRLNHILSSINSFNKQSLRRTITRDRSSPMLNIHALWQNMAKQAVLDSKNSNNTTVDINTARIGQEKIGEVISPEALKQSQTETNIFVPPDETLGKLLECRDEMFTSSVESRHNDLLESANSEDEPRSCQQSVDSNSQVLFEISIEDIHKSSEVNELEGAGLVYEPGMSGLDHTEPEADHPECDTLLKQDHTPGEGEAENSGTESADEH